MRILQPGRNCWRIRRADKVAFIIDGASYFETLYKSLPLARQQILVLAWDIYSELNLVPPGGPGAQRYPTKIRDLLNYLVQKNEGLHVNILNWDFSLLVSMSREWLPIYKLDWKTHKHFRFCLDNHNPVGASHHQKVVVIDDRLAFSGGLDLTRGRWDTPEHRADDRRRAAVDGSSLPLRPFHDVQMAVAGPAAAALGSLARERWRRCNDYGLPVPGSDSGDLWPADLPVDIRDVDVAISRTVPAYGDYTETREVEMLFADAIAAARRYIYIENQFFTAPVVSHALAKRLQETDGPEIIIVLPLKTEGWLSQNSLDILRYENIKILRDNDKHGRLAVYYPRNPISGDLPINLHAKIMIVDDRFVRVGSANINNRSMGLDSECDLSIEADTDDQAAVKAIQDFRNRLLAEHLDHSPAEVQKQIESHHSLLAGIHSLTGRPRSLETLELEITDADKRLLQDIKLTDPERPFDADTVLRHFIPERQTKPAGHRVAYWVVTLIILLILAAAWRLTSLNEIFDISSLNTLADNWRNSSYTPLLMILAFIIGSLLIMPVTALIIIAVLVFGPVEGLFYALLGSLLSSICGYGLGNVLGRNIVRNLSGERINQVSRRLARRGILTMIVVRIVPVAPFTIINMIAGASHIHFRDFVLGTLLGMTPGIFGIALLTDRVAATLRQPDWNTLLTLVIVAAIVFTAGYFLSKRLLLLSSRKKRFPKKNSGQELS